MDKADHRLTAQLSFLRYEGHFELSATLRDQRSPKSPYSHIASRVLYMCSRANLITANSCTGGLLLPSPRVTTPRATVTVMRTSDTSGTQPCCIGTSSSSPVGSCLRMHATSTKLVSWLYDTQGPLSFTSISTIYILMLRGN